MPGKQSQNKFRDLMGDYYKTNRQISSEQSKDDNDRGINSREKSMIIILVILVLVLILKSVVFDEVRNLNPDEQQFKDFVDYSVEQEYRGTLEDMGLMVYRVYDIYLADPNENGIIKYLDAKSGKIVEVTQEGRYNARVRGYLLWVIPVKHFSVTSKIID